MSTRVYKRILPFSMIDRPDLVERLGDKFVFSPDGCWLWTAVTTPNGYGKIGVNGQHLGAHRVMYELIVGPVPEGLVIDHLCKVRHCVNPAHLEPVTQRENLLRADTIQARNAAKTHCIHGHEFSPKNTYIQSDGGRRCRRCNADRNRIRNQQRALAHV